jgi:hypothetical protein
VDASAGLVPCDYTLRFTGTAQLAGRYRIDLTTDAVPQWRASLRAPLLGALPRLSTNPTGRCLNVGLPYVLSPTQHNKLAAGC